jgi:hypothetical protein
VKNMMISLGFNHEKEYGNVLFFGNGHAFLKRKDD